MWAARLGGPNHGRKLARSASSAPPTKKAARRPVAPWELVPSGATAPVAGRQEQTRPLRASALLAPSAAESGLALLDSVPRSHCEARSEGLVSLSTEQHGRREAPLESLVALPNDRRRVDMPPEVKEKSTGSAERAIAIASDAEALRASIAKFRELSYAPTTAASKASGTLLSEKVMSALDLAPYPVCCRSLMCVVAVLRESRYRSGAAYHSEARQRHLRLECEWTDTLDFSMADAKRGLE